jgi:glutaminyl-tRNA synthetase
MAYYAEVIKESVKWLGADWGDRLFYASDYFEQMYEWAVLLVKKGVAFVCDLNADQMREYRGTLTQAGTPSPNKDRSIEENLDLFTRMKNGEFSNGAKTLRAKIDMASPNMNLRDPVIYRIIHTPHYNAGDWCIYPTYDYAHPLEDAIEGITHSLCGLEFENNRPIYDWYLDQIGEAIGGFNPRPRQIEFAELHITNTILGKRHIRKLIADGIVNDWDDPRLLTILGMRRRGYSPRAIRNFVEAAGVAKAHSKVDITMLEHFVREDLAQDAKVIMAVLNPVKLVITNYPKGQVEWLDMPNNPKNPEMGTRQIPFSGEVYIEADDFMAEPPPKYHRLFPGNEVRLAGAYFVTCTGFVTDENGVVTEIHATYDIDTKSGSDFNARKVKGTIHWVCAANAVTIRANLYDYLVIDDAHEEEGFRFNENSLTAVENAVAEPSVLKAAECDRFQFMRNAYFCLDTKTSTPGQLSFNRIVEIKSSYKPS